MACRLRRMAQVLELDIYFSHQFPVGANRDKNELREVSQRPVEVCPDFLFLRRLRVPASRFPGSAIILTTTQSAT